MCVLCVVLMTVGVCVYVFFTLCFMFLLFVCMFVLLFMFNYFILISKYLNVFQLIKNVFVWSLKVFVFFKLLFMFLLCRFCLFMFSCFIRIIKDLYGFYCSDLKVAYVCFVALHGFVRICWYF